MSTKGKIPVLISALLVVGVAAATVFTLSQKNQPVPKFSYDSSAVGGWWSSENANLQMLAKRAGNNYRSDEPINKLPVADLTVHHGEKDAEAPKDYCFVAFSYFNYPLDGLDVAYEKYESRKKEQGNLEALEPLTQTVKTFEGDKGYELRRYNYIIEDQDVLSGYQVGYAELQSGYIRVEGVCKTADDLALTLPVLQSVTLNEH